MDVVLNILPAQRALPFHATPLRRWIRVEGKAIVNRASPIWTVFVGDIGDPNRDYPAPTRLNVTRAWFLSNPAA